MRKRTAAVLSAIFSAAVFSSAHGETQVFPPRTAILTISGKDDFEKLVREETWSITYGGETCYENTCTKHVVPRWKYEKYEFQGVLPRPESYTKKGVFEFDEHDGADRNTHLEIVYYQTCVKVFSEQCTRITIVLEASGSRIPEEQLKNLTASGRMVLGGYVYGQDRLPGSIEIILVPDIDTRYPKK